MRQTGIVNGKKKAALGFDKAKKPIFSASTTSSGHDKRHKKHADEMGMPFKSWVSEAAGLLNDEEREYYLDWEIPDEDTLHRLNLRTNRLVVGDIEGKSINTYFILEKHKAKYYLPDIYLEKLGKKK